MARWIAAVLCERRLSWRYRVIVARAGLYGDWETGRNVYPSARWLAAQVGCDRGTVLRALKAAVALGYLKPDGRKGRGGSNRYRAVLPPGQQLVREAGSEGAPGAEVAALVNGQFVGSGRTKEAASSAVGPEVAAFVPEVAALRMRPNPTRGGGAADAPTPLRSVGAAALPLSAEVVEVVREVASRVKVGLDAQVLHEQVSRLLSSWHSEQVIAVATERLRANRRHARNASRFLATDLARIDPATFQLPASDGDAPTVAQHAQEAGDEEQLSAQEEAAWDAIHDAMNEVTAQLKQVDPARAEAFDQATEDVLAKVYRDDMAQRRAAWQCVERERRWLTNHQPTTTKEHQP
jgi:hypothetical protein